MRHLSLLRPLVWSVVASAVFPFASHARGQADAERPGNSSASGAAADAQAAFQRTFEDYKQAVRQIEELRIEFQTADAARRTKINEELTGHVAHAQSLVNTMVEAATEVHRLSPNTDPKITSLLLAIVRHYVQGQAVPNAPGRIIHDGQYEKALPLIKLLLDSGVEDRRLFAWGFLCAFVTNDCDLASEYLDQLRRTHAIPDPGGISDPAERSAMTLVVKFAVELQRHCQKWGKESALRAAEAAADDLPRVKLTTTKGEITLELFENEAPQTVANFLTLVKQGYYNGTPFHRVIAGFMVQGGAKTDDGGGGPGYTIRCECVRPDHRNHFRGSVSMAHAGRDTGNSQFFITMVPTSHLDGEHTVFGRVTEGIEVLADIVRREPKPDEPEYNASLPTPDRILTAEVLRDRGHEYTFERLPE